MLIRISNPRARVTLLLSALAVFFVAVSTAAQIQRPAKKSTIAYPTEAVPVPRLHHRNMLDVSRSNLFTDFADTINSTVSSGAIFNNATTGNNGGFFHLGTYATDAYWGAASSTGGSPFADTLANSAIFFGDRDNVPLQFLTSSAVRMTISGGGNVGIGTTSPQSILDVGKSQITPAFKIGNSNYGASYNSVWGLQSGAQSIMIFGNNGQNEIRAGNTNSGGYLDFYTNNTADYTSGANGIFVMRLANNGNVGVGTTSPSYRLHLKGTSDNQFLLDNDGSTYTSMYWANNGTKAALAYYNATSNQFRIGGFGTNTVTVFTTNTDTERMRIDAGGNVGIGTMTPQYKLDVNGNTNVTGNITATGSIAAKYQDVAEWVPSSEKLSPGTVVVLDATKSNQVTSSTVSYDTRVAGVVSEQPGIALGEKSDGKVLVATTGRVRVKVDATRNPIQTGDLLVTSDVPGMAMKSEPIIIGGRQIHAPGTLIGKALETLEKGKGEILVLLSLQ